MQEKHEMNDFITLDAKNESFILRKNFTPASVFSLPLKSHRQITTLLFENNDVILFFAPVLQKIVHVTMSKVCEYRQFDYSPRLSFVLQVSQLFGIRILCSLVA